MSLVSLVSAMFCKHFRFLSAKKNFEKFSFAWDLMFLCAEAYPCLWYCTPVVKSVLGALMAQCETSMEKNKVKVPPKLLTIMDKWFLLTRQVIWVWSSWQSG